MVKCICIDDSSRPKSIPQNKWVKLGYEYSIIYTVVCLPQREIGVTLAEIELDDSCIPFEYYKLNRFSFSEEELQKLIALIKNCSELDFSVDELLLQTNLEEV